MDNGANVKKPPVELLFVLLHIGNKLTVGKITVVHRLNIIMHFYTCRRKCSVSGEVVTQVTGFKLQYRFGIHICK